MKNPIHQKYVELGCLSCTWKKSLQLDGEDPETFLACPECGSKAITRVYRTSMRPSHRSTVTENIRNPWWKFWS